MKISWIADAGIRAETSQGLILFNHDEKTLNESSQKDENTIAIFLNENLKKNSEKKNQLHFPLNFLVLRVVSQLKKLSLDCFHSTRLMVPVKNVKVLEVI